MDATESKPEPDTAIEDALVCLINTDGEGIDHCEIAVKTATLVQRAAEYRAQAAFWRGRAKSQAELIAWQKARIDQLEARTL